MRMKELRKLKKEQFLQEKGGLVKKLGEVFKQGYMPQRGTQTYMYAYCFDPEVLMGDIINCFGHAAFNLTNEMIEKLGLTMEELEPIWRFGEKQNQGVTFSDEIEGFIRQTGLKIEPCGLHTKMKKNQWKIAYYMRHLSEGIDYHFILQEKDGRWSSKNGQRPKVETFVSDPPKMWKDKYYLCGYYCITNPYVNEFTGKPIFENENTSKTNDGGITK